MQQRETSDKKNLRKAYEEANSILPKTLPYITNKEAENIIKSVVKKPFSPHLEKKGGYIKKYARGSIVRKVRGY